MARCPGWRLTGTRVPNRCLIANLASRPSESISVATDTLVDALPEHDALRLMIRLLG